MFSRALSSASWHSVTHMSSWLWLLLACSDSLSLVFPPPQVPAYTCYYLMKHLPINPKFHSQNWTHYPSFETGSRMPDLSEWPSPSIQASISYVIHSHSPKGSPCPINLHLNCFLMSSAISISTTLIQVLLPFQDTSPKASWLVSQASVSPYCCVASTLLISL